MYYDYKPTIIFHANSDWDESKVKRADNGRFTSKSDSDLSMVPAYLRDQVDTPEKAAAREAHTNELMKLLEDAKNKPFDSSKPIIRGNVTQSPEDQEIVDRIIKENPNMTPMERMNAIQAAKNKIVMDKINNRNSTPSGKKLNATANKVAESIDKRVDTTISTVSVNDKTKDITSSVLSRIGNSKLGNKIKEKAGAIKDFLSVKITSSKQRRYNDKTGKWEDIEYKDSIQKVIDDNKKKNK